MLEDSMVIEPALGIEPVVAEVTLPNSFMVPAAQAC
jgi:hypothetical protein